MVGTQKTVTVNVLEDFPVALRQPERGNFGRSFEPGKADRTHDTILPRDDERQKLHRESSFPLLQCPPGLFDDISQIQAKSIGHS